MSLKELGEYQKLLINYSIFTPRQVACLITDYNPAYHHNDDFYNARLNMVENAIEAKQLTIINDKEHIAAKEVLLWLIECNLIYKGFNDGLRYDTLEAYHAEHSNQKPIVAETSKQTNQELIAENAKIKALESELKKANEALADNAAHNQKTEKQGDSLLILGAVMHCIKDAAKKNFTQELLTQTILDKYKNVSGISRSTLNKKYTEAKTYIEQRHTP